MRKLYFLLSLVALLITNVVYAQQQVSPGTMQKLQQAYKKKPRPEISFERFVEINKHIYRSTADNADDIIVSNLTIGSSCIKSHTWSGNGDFESGLDTSQWLGAYGTFFDVPDPATMTDGFVSGGLYEYNAHQTIVTAGIDLITGISLIPPNGGTKALRLGNAINGAGTEMIAKTVTIDSAHKAILTFWYAVVFEDPRHLPQEQPAFTVRVFDCATGQEITGVCNLGNGSNKLISDTDNPFFNTADGYIAYRDWTRAEISLTQYVGKKVTIQLINNDCSLTGHFGYTYLDNFGFAFLSMREPGDNLKDDNKIKTDVDGISKLMDSAVLNRDGVSADGVTRLLIIGRSTKSFTLSLPAGDGFLSKLNDQNNKQTSIQVTPVLNAKGESMIIAVYTAPDGYGPQPLTWRGRPTVISIEETGNPGTKQETTLSIFTPPVVLMHGLWSNGLAWTENGVLPYMLQQGFRSTKAITYSGYLTYGLGAYVPALPEGVRELDKVSKELIAAYRRDNIAATQIDVVAHDMGGLVSRSYIGSSGYRSAFNYQQGSIHKLITLGTPHQGTPVADVLWRIRNNKARLPLAGNQLTISQVFELGGYPINSAVRDLQTNSPALPALGVSKVKAHAIAGKYGPDNPSTSAYTRWNKFINTVDPLSKGSSVATYLQRVDNLFGEQHDLVADLSSQMGGLQPAFTSTFDSVLHSSFAFVYPGTNAQPNTELNSVTIHQKIKDLLLTGNVSLFATEFPVPAISPSANMDQSVSEGVVFANSAMSAQAGSDYIQIISPVSGTTFNNTDSIELEFQMVGNVTPASGFFMIRGMGIVQVPQTPPYRVKIKLKNPPIGKVDIVAIARDTTHVFADEPLSATYGTLFVDTISIITGSGFGYVYNFWVDPDSLLLDSLNSQQALTVSGIFFDGIDSSFADLSHTQTGTAYFPRLGNAVVKVDDNGMVTGLSAGNDVIEIYNTRTYNVLYVPVRVVSLCSVPQPVITRSGNTLISSSATGNQWFSNGIPIESANGNSYLPPGPGIYSVQVTKTCASSMSDTVHVLVVQAVATTYYQDLDNDQYGNPNVTIVDTIKPAGYVTQSGDCNDWNPAINPGATEICNFQDDDCDGLIDEGCTVFYRDQDGDNYGLWNVQIRAITRPPGYATVGGDCNDTVAAINPGATEICNGINDNCNGLTDEGCTTFYRDVDGDGYGRNDQTIVAMTRPPGYALVGGDCDDFTPSINPGATEVCNFRDDDCDGVVDEGCIVFYRDQDGDGYGLWHVQIRAMTRPPGYANIGGDCDDTNPVVNPGATEICNGINDNCNGLTDEGCRTFFRDVDGDGYGRSDQTIVATSRPPGYALVGGDCDDFTPSINPGATEVCNFRDDDCDGLIDEGCQVFYRDADGDGYGLWNQQIRAMTRPAGYANIGGDCDDTNPAVNPGATEICNGINDNCNGLTDEGCRTFFRDVDGDGYGRSDQTIVATSRPPGYALVGGDCDDFTPSINPGATEVCNFRDDDCDGLVDEGCVVFYRDADGDGYGLWNQQIRAMTRPPGYANIGGDCDDTNPAVNPGATEICNGINDNCNGLTDEGCRTFFRDVDGDGYGRSDQTIVATSRPPGYALVGGDCDDFTPSINPGAPEVCNFRDDDCDGVVDEGCMVFYRDQDGDNYGLWNQQIRALLRPLGYANIGGDCNDTVAAINPGATEICNGINDDCDGLTDEGCITLRNNIEVQLQEDKTPAELGVLISPNPSGNLFNVRLNSSNREEKITVRVFNNLSRLIEMKDNLSAGQIVRLGEGYRRGIYVLEARQGSTRKTIKIIKL